MGCRVWRYISRLSRNIGCLSCSGPIGKFRLLGVAMPPMRAANGISSDHSPGLTALNLAVAAGASAGAGR